MTTRSRSQRGPPAEHALGLIEIQSMVAAVEAADVMLKTASVRLVGIERIGCAFLTVVIRGDVASVGAAVEAGRAAVVRLGEVVGTSILPAPDGQLEGPFPLSEAPPEEPFVCIC